MASNRWTGVSSVLPDPDRSPFEGRFVYLIDDVDDEQDRVLTIREWTQLRTQPTAETPVLGEEDQLRTSGGRKR